MKNYNYKNYIDSYIFTNFNKYNTAGITRFFFNNPMPFDILLYLLNHYFYSRLNSYFRQKNPDVHNRLFTLITSQINVLPLIDIKEDNSEFLSYYEPIQKLFQKKDKKEYDPKRNVLNTRFEPDLITQQLKDNPYIIR